jgi:ABC-type lipoprotein export system ATPase subunit
MPDAPSTSSTADGVSCSRLVRIYPSATGETHALRGVDAAFAPGTFTAVTGPSGSGKSSLLRVLALRERPDGGEVQVLGTDPAAASPRTLRRLRRDRLAWVPQRSADAVLTHLTAREHLSVVARLRGGGRDAVGAALAAVGLADRADVRCALLSGGEQQRLAVTAACVGAPGVVVADEPTAELDDGSTALVAALLAARAAAGSVVVVATHDARLVAAAGRVLHLRHGVLSTDSVDGRALAAIDPTGRLQLPPEALALFPGLRAHVVVDADGVHLLPPTTPDEDAL